MRRLVVPLIVVSLVAGVEMGARRIEDGVPEPLTWDTQFSQDKAEQLERWGERLELVVTGSSVAQANIDPALFVELSPQFTTGYNVGLPSMTPQVWRQFLIDAVYRDHCPSLLIIAVDIRQFSDTKPGSDSQLDRYLSTRGRLEYVGEDDFWRTSEEWLEAHSALFRIRPRLREPDKVVAWIWDIGEVGDWRNTNLTPEGRYQSNDNRTYEASEERLANLRDGAFRDLSLGGKETNAVGGIIDDAAARGVRVVLVETPSMSEQLARALPNGDDDLVWFTEVLTGIADEHDIPLLRFPEMDDQPVYYSDDYHMNWNGIEYLTTRLAEEVASLQLDLGTGVCPIG